MSVLIEWESVTCCFARAKPDSVSEQAIIKLVDKLLSLNQYINEIGDKKTDERQRLESEIRKSEKEIDELIYDIYGMSDAEKKIIDDMISR